MFLISLSQKNIKKLFKRLVFSSFEDNKPPDGTRVQQGPTLQMNIDPVATFQDMDKELITMVKQVKEQLAKAGIREFLSAPSYMLDANGHEMFVISILVVESRIEIASGLPQTPEGQGPPSGSPLIRLK